MKERLDKIGVILERIVQRNEAIAIFAKQENGKSSAIAILPLLHVSMFTSKVKDSPFWVYMVILVLVVVFLSLPIIYQNAIKLLPPIYADTAKVAGMAILI